MNRATYAYGFVLKIEGKFVTQNKAGNPRNLNDAKIFSAKSLDSIITNINGGEHIEFFRVKKNINSGYVSRCHEEDE